PASPFAAWRSPPASSQNFSTSAPRALPPSRRRRRRPSCSGSCAHPLGERSRPLFRVLPLVHQASTFGTDILTLDHGLRFFRPRGNSANKGRTVMCKALRGFIVLSALLCLMVLLPGVAASERRHDRQSSANNQDENNNHDENNGGGGASCGAESEDADQVAAVRAMAEGQCDCAGATSHDDYVDCVEMVTEEAVENGSLRPPCSGAVMSCESRSTCGRPGFVTCCRTNSNGNTSCSIKSSESACNPPRGGTACVGSVPSCCDACGPGGTCGAPATTTTAAATTTTTGAATTTTTTTGP